MQIEKWSENYADYNVKRQVTKFDIDGFSSFDDFDSTEEYEMFTSEVGLVGLYGYRISRVLFELN